MPGFEQWQIDQGKACSCRGVDDMCPCQNTQKVTHGSDEKLLPEGVKLKIRRAIEQEGLHLSDDELAYLIRREGGPNPAGLSTRSLGKGLTGEGAVRLRERLIAESNRRAAGPWRHPDDRAASQDAAKQRPEWESKKARDLEFSVRTTSILVRDFGDPQMVDIFHWTDEQMRAKSPRVSKKVLNEIREMILYLRVNYP